jgi:uncharacterized membrane protein YcaP (DUF421 family)
MPVSEWLLGASSHDINWWQMTVRGVVVFVYGACLIRLLGRKAFGKNSALDIVLSIIIGSTLSRAMTANAPMIPALVASAAMVLLHFGLSRASTRLDWLDHLVKGRAALVVRDGRPIEEALRRAEISRDDLMEQVRLRGRKNTLEEIAAVYAERNGNLSVIPKG